MMRAALAFRRVFEGQSGLIREGAEQHNLDCRCSGTATTGKGTNGILLRVSLMVIKVASSFSPRFHSRMFSLSAPALAFV